jgi:AraC-like DNA-binding protein
MIDDSYISGSLVKTILEVAQSKGVKSQELLNIIALKDTDLEDPLSRVSLDDVIILFQEIIRITKDEAIGLRVGQNIRPGSLNALGYALMSCSNVYEAFLLQKAFGGAIADCAELSLVKDGEVASLLFTVKHDDLNLVRPINDMFMSMFWNYCQWITRVDAELIGTSLTHAEPSYVDEYLKVFRVSPSFSSDQCSLIFDTKYLAAELYQADVAMNVLMKERAENLLLDVKSSASLYAAVANQIRKLMPQKKATLVLIAKGLNMSDRSLSRKLKMDGYTFKSILFTVRESLALEYLRDVNVPIIDIANQLGYRDYSAFSHAFRSWTGQSPSEFRECLEKESGEKKRD